MSNILVIGGTKFFGLRLVEKLIADGHHVIILSRVKNLPATISGSVEHICLDLSFQDGESEYDRNERINKALQGKKFEIVVDNVSWLEREAKSAIECLVKTGNRIIQYIYCSSVAAYFNWNRNKESKSEILESEINLDANGYFPDIFAPTFRDFYKLYTQGKRFAEQEVMEGCAKFEINFTIMRPVVIEGPNDPHLRTWFWIQRLLDGQPIIVPETEPATLYKHVYSDDVAEAFRLAVNNPKAYNTGYNIAGEETLTVEEYIYNIADILGIDRSELKIIALDPKIVASQIEGFEFPPFFSGLSLLSNIDKAKIELGYKPQPIQEWLKKTVNWCMEKRREGQMPDSLGYQNRDKEITLAGEYLSSKGTLRM